MPGLCQRPLPTVSVAGTVQHRRILLPLRAFGPQTAIAAGEQQQAAVSRRGEELAAQLEAALSGASDEAARVQALEAEKAKLLEAQATLLSQVGTRSSCPHRGGTAGERNVRPCGGLAKEAAAHAPAQAAQGHGPLLAWPGWHHAGRSGYAWGAGKAQCSRALHSTQRITMTNPFACAWCAPRAGAV